MRLGISRMEPGTGRAGLQEVIFNFPEVEETEYFLTELKRVNPKPGDTLYVEQSNQLCSACRLKKILQYQLGLSGVNINYFVDGEIWKK